MEMQHPKEENKGKPIEEDSEMLLLWKVNEWILKALTQGWEYGSVVECVSGIHNILGLIPITTNKNKFKIHICTTSNPLSPCMLLFLSLWKIKIHKT